MYLCQSRPEKKLRDACEQPELDMEEVLVRTGKERYH